MSANASTPISSAGSSEYHLTAARYGKDKVRVCRVVRNGDWHDIVEYNVCTLVEGDIATRCVRGLCNTHLSILPPIFSILYPLTP